MTNFSDDELSIISNSLMVDALRLSDLGHRASAAIRWDLAAKVIRSKTNLIITEKVNECHTADGCENNARMLLAGGLDEFVGIPCI